MDAGWYLHPDDPLNHHYWDGTQWTGHTQPVQPAAPPSPPPTPTAATPWGDPSAAPNAVPGWGTPAPQVPVHHAAAAKPARRRSFPLVPLLALLVLAGGIVAAVVLLSGDDEETASVPIGHVTKVYEAAGVTCTPPSPTMTPTEAAKEAVDGIPVSLQTQTGLMTQGQFGELMNIATKMGNLAEQLPADSTYGWMRCGGSWVLTDADAAYAVANDPATIAQREDLTALGIPVSQLPTGTAG